MKHSNIIQDGTFEGIRDLLPENTKVICITDTNVNNLYSGLFPAIDVIVIGAGEENKTIDTVVSVYRKLLSLEADRESFILAVGGGIVCDIAGFVASTFMRGIRFAFVPTTLLAQVDASYGGKNGVNLDGYKNIVGIFRQPEFVFVDSNFLNTLDEKEFSCGLAEVVKHALIKDKNLFNFLENNYRSILEKDKVSIDRIIKDSIRIKMKVVDEDEFEKGERRKLNFGHTIGHGLEKLTDLSHGEAVSVGMSFAARLSASLNKIDKNLCGRIDALLRKFNLPISMNVDLNDLYNAIVKDKKKTLNDIHFVILNGEGSSETVKFSVKELEKVLKEIY